jgi:hypothetical protein
VIRISFLNVGKDMTYLNVSAAGWSVGEQCAGIICACLPTLHWLLIRLVPERLTGYSRSQSGRHRYDHNAHSGISKANHSRTDAPTTNKTLTSSSAGIASRIQQGSSTDELTRPEEFEMVSTPPEKQIGTVRTLSAGSSDISVTSIEPELPVGTRYSRNEEQQGCSYAITKPTSVA